MKRYILLSLLVALSTTSCWVETTYNAPRATQYAERLLDEVDYSLGTAGRMMQLAIVLDDWIAEDDAQAKFEKECYYFSYYKLFQGNNGVVTIDCTPGSTSSIITVDTSEKSIFEDGAKWTFTIDQESITITNTAKDKWSVESDKFLSNRDMKLSFALLSKKIDEITFYIDGSAESNAKTLADSEQGVEYEIKETLKSTLFTTGEYIYYAQSAARHMDGVIEYELPKVEGAESAKIEYLAENYYKIYYRGFIEEYGYKNL